MDRRGFLRLSLAGAASAMIPSISSSQPGAQEVTIPKPSIDDWGGMDPNGDWIYAKHGALPTSVPPSIEINPKGQMDNRQTLDSSGGLRDEWGEMCPQYRYDPNYGTAYNELAAMTLHAS